MITIRVEQAIARLHEFIDELKEESIIVDDDAGHREVEIIQQIAESYTGGWIPCSDSLPEKENVFVLISCVNDVGYEFVQEALFYRDDFGNHVFDCLYFYDKVLA